jgi:hypothetical protein
VPIGCIGVDSSIGRPRWADENALTGTLGIDPEVQVYTAEAGKWKLS